MSDLMKKPGYRFQLQPQNNLESDESPKFTQYSSAKQHSRIRHSDTGLLTMPASPAPCFGDDDLEFISSQTADLLLDGCREAPALSSGHHTVIDLVSSPVTGAEAVLPTPVLGHWTQIHTRQPQQKPRRAKDPEAGMFIPRQISQASQHHRDLYRQTGPLKAKKPPTSQISSRKQGPLQMFASSESDARKPVHYQSSAAFGGQVSYTDPTKANADLKALLEGGMDEAEDEDNASGVNDVDNRHGEVGNKDVAPGRTEIGEDGSLEGIKVKLLPHQVEGVRWMRGRELGPIKRGKVPKGGILADDMGLGKTLQSISLIVSNRMPAGPDAPGWQKQFGSMGKATLVVAPLALIRQWEAEIKEKVDQRLGLKVCLHHGPQRSKCAKLLGRHDVVITTYQVLTSEHGRSGETLDSPQMGCFGVNWYRVILDEAHSIKNRNAKSTKAACALRAEYRWCLTGTPMQNHLDELQSLVHFLRIQPYDDLSEWRAKIDAPMKSGRGQVAIGRLHSLLQCFMKRRTKDILKEEAALVAGGKKALDAAKAKAKEAGREDDAGEIENEAPKPAFRVTERKIVTVAAEFSAAEKAFYSRLEDRADASLERMMKSGKKVNYANALVLLLRLRQACNHPRLTQTSVEKNKDCLGVDVPTQTHKATESDLDALADAFGGMGIHTRQCDVCFSELSHAEVGDGQMRCLDCIQSLEELHSESKARKRSKKGRRSVVGEDSKVEKLNEKQQKARKRNIVVDSDDEDEEADGSWLVPENQRGLLRLGKAGGSDDENAEGGGDDIGSEDSDHPSEEEDESQLGSFVVDDEDVKRQRAVGPDQDRKDDDADQDASLVCVAKKLARKVQPMRPDSSSEGDSIASSARISESSMGSDSDSDNGPRRNLSLHPNRNAKDHVMMSAKIRELVSIIREEVVDHKFIVFSQFTSMLDLIEPFLGGQPGLESVRYDGKMTNGAREAALHALRTNKNTRILLCSLKCGSLGLNLTAATRVVIVEPFWNPFVEEQAIDRVHRLTQTVDVVVYRLTIAGTVEERILELQNKKRKLAEATIEGGMRKNDKRALKLGLNEILDLFKHDAKDMLGDNATGHAPLDDRLVGQNMRGGITTRKTPAARQPESEIYGRR